MSTQDVPGANPRNYDELAMGCWAEHSDGSLIFVESTEADRIVFSMFDVKAKPILEYRDAMPKTDFEKAFSWDPKAKETKTAKGKVPQEKWTWHDKTPFPWDRIIKQGFSDGMRHASADETRTAAERIAESLRIRGREYDERHEHRIEQELPRRGGGMSAKDRVWDKIERALNELMK